MAAPGPRAEVFRRVPQRHVLRHAADFPPAVPRNAFPGMHVAKAGHVLTMGRESGELDRAIRRIATP